MRVAVDIDGTVEHGVSQIKELCLNNEVYFITTRNKSLEQRKVYLQALGITGYRDIVIVEGHDQNVVGYNKAEWVRDNQIDVFIEDNILALEYVNRLAPNVLCLLVISYAK